MNKFFSLFAAALAFAATTTAAAATTTQAQDSAMEVQMDQTMEGAVTLDVMVQFADGTTTRKSEEFRTENEAMEAYFKMLSTLPEGARIVRAQITGGTGQIDLNTQG